MDLGVWNVNAACHRMARRYVNGLDIRRGTYRRSDNQPAVPIEIDLQALDVTSGGVKVCLMDIVFTLTCNANFPETQLMLS